MIYKSKDIRTVHLEITDKCNAACPQCGRNILGGKDNPYLANTELTLEDCKTIFPADFIQQLNRMFMCGNYGDPVVARDTLEVYEYFKQVNPKIKLGMNTNGSLKKPEWWSELGKLFQSEWSSVRFGIDGLADTNHLYRRRTNFNKIMENAEAFIAAGGNAVWDFIVFKHNEHQVEEAKALSEKLGFKKFQAKKTGRFFSNTRMQGKDRQEVQDKNGNIEYFIEKPTITEWQNKSLENEQNLVTKYGSLNSYLDHTPVRCKVAEEKSVYVSAEGLIFPCCWTANQMYLWYFKEKSTQIWSLVNKVGIENISAKNKSLTEIIDGEFFDLIRKSWNLNSCGEGKLKVCAKTCGTEFDPFGEQFK